MTLKNSNMICYIACDNLDPTLGKYFSDCADICSNYINFYLEEQGNLINGVRLNQANIDLTLQNKTEDKFLFTAYSHGTENALLANHLPYLKVDLNTQYFKGGLVYTNACLSAQELGPDLVNNGAFAFVGYNEEVPVLHDENVKKIMRDADNYALIFFLTGETIGDAVKRAKNYLTTKILHLQELNNPDRAELIVVRDAMEVIGNENLTISDLLS
jgi:hypothetical protein